MIDHLAAVRRAARRRVVAELAFRTAVVAASVDGKHSLRAIAAAAGITHVGVLKIVRKHGEGDGQS